MHTHYDRELKVAFSLHACSITSGNILIKHDTEQFYEKVYNLNYRTLDKRFCLSLERHKIFETKVADTKGADNWQVSVLHVSDKLNQKNDVYIYELYSEQWPPVCQSHLYYQVKEKWGRFCCGCTMSIISLFFLWRVPFAYDSLLHTSRCLCLSYDSHTKVRSFLTT